MTLSPNAETTHEVVGVDHITVGYFASGDSARAYAATVAGSKVMIYLSPAR